MYTPVELMLTARLNAGVPATDDSLDACCLGTALDLLLHLAVQVLDGVVVPLDHLQVRHQRAQAGDLLCLHIRIPVSTQCHRDLRDTVILVL